MNADRWSQVKEILAGALERPREERRAWIARACAGDYDLGTRVGALLDAYEADPDFLEAPPALDPDDLSALAALAPGGTDPALQPGVVLGAGRYRIIGELGHGGMGVVYLAQDLRLPRRVAMKSLPESARHDPSRLERLRREAWAAAKISHPAVATIYAFEELDGQPFIVSEYVRGRTVREEIARGALPPPRALGIALNIARALAAAHDEGVVHRDLKPENVIITEAGAVKVVDFGLAQLARDEAPALTREGTWLGTPAYMAPEQREGGDVDHRADIYSFGLVLAEMLTGRHPLRPRTSAGGAGNPGAPAAPPRIDPPLDAIVKRCLQVQPQDRYPTARALLADLETAHRGLSPEITDRRSARWWWEFHQAATAAVYWTIVIVVWSAWALERERSGIVPDLYTTFFIVVLASAVVSGNLRLNLWFTSRFFPGELERVRRQMRPWIRTGDWTLVAALTIAGLASLAFREDANRSFVFIGLGIGAAVVASLIEPVTTRAAFETTER